MKPISKRIITLLLLLFLSIHFVFITNYSAPYKLKGLVKSAAGMYCYPYFHQQWTVFVPAPDKKSDLYIRNGSEERWQPWINITQRLIKKRKQNPLKGRETEVLLLTNATNYMVYELGERNIIFENKPTLASFKVLERAAKYYFRNYGCWSEGKNYELVLVTKTSKRIYVYYFKNLSLL